MFTGIVQNQGIVVRKQKRGGIIRFSFKLKKKETPMKVGESIAVDGVCLTVVACRPRHFDADAIHETLQVTTLGDLKLDDRVNLERSLKVGDRIGGHFVTGHVDAAGQVAKIERRGRNRVLYIKAPKNVIRRLAVKGSIAVDGISLTIQAIKDLMFQVSIVPHTLKETTLGRKKAGDFMNLEIDLIARYLKMITNAVGRKPSRRITKITLKKQGF